jgi:hypothetical protein
VFIKEQSLKIFFSRIIKPEKFKFTWKLSFEGKGLETEEPKTEGKGHETEEPKTERKRKSIKTTKQSPKPGLYMYIHL